MPNGIFLLYFNNMYNLYYSLYSAIFATLTFLYVVILLLKAIRKKKACCRLFKQMRVLSLSLSHTHPHNLDLSKKKKNAICDICRFRLMQRYNQDDRSDKWY